MDKLTSFISTCIILSDTDKSLHFMTLQGQIYGLDMERQMLFEPTSVNKFNILKNKITESFTDKHKLDLETEQNLQFDELISLEIKSNHREKHLGKLFFYSKQKSCVYAWSLTTGKWQCLDIDTVRSLFANNYVMLDDAPVKKSVTAQTLDELGVNFDDLEEISLKFKDCTNHYYHPKLGKVFSLNMKTCTWSLQTNTGTIEKLLECHLNTSDQ